MAPFFGALLVFSSTLSWWEMVENLSRWEMVLFGGVEAESSPEDYHFRGDRTQNDGDISRSLTLKPSIYIHDLSQIIFMYTVYLSTLSPWYKTDRRTRRSCRISVARPLVLSDSNHGELKIFNLAISAGFKWFYCSLVPSSSQVESSIRSSVKVHGPCSMEFE